MTTPFDYVEWKPVGGDARRLDAGEFLKVPLRIRVRGLLRQEFRFFKDTAELPATEALDRMARASMNG